MGQYRGDGGVGGMCLFRSSSKCSAHLVHCRSVPWIVFPSLSLTGRIGLLYLPVSFQVMSHRCFVLLVAAASSASSARLSVYLRLSALALLFTSLLACVKSSCALAFAALVRLLFTATFRSFHSWILRKVSAVIHSFCWCLLGPTTS